MIFKTYMIKNFIDDKGCKGVHDFYRRRFEKYKQADDGVLAAFEECIAKWKEQVGK